MNKTKLNLFFSLVVALFFCSLFFSYFPKTNPLQLSEMLCPNGHHDLTKIPVLQGDWDISPRLSKMIAEDKLCFRGGSLEPLYLIKCKKCAFEAELNHGVYHFWLATSSDTGIYPISFSHTIKRLPEWFKNTLDNNEPPVFFQEYIFTDTAPIPDNIFDKENEYYARIKREPSKKNLAEECKLSYDNILKKYKSFPKVNLSVLYIEEVEFYSFLNIEEIIHEYKNYCAAMKIPLPSEQKMSSNDKLLHGIDVKYISDASTNIFECVITKQINSGRCQILLKRYNKLLKLLTQYNRLKKE